MVIIRIVGGLGNQMQQYALSRKLISLGREVCLDISTYSDAGYQGTVRKLEIDRFPAVKYDAATEEQITSVRGDRGLFGRIRSRIRPGRSGYVHESGMYMPEILEMDNVYLDGYWSAEKYYADIMPELREIYDFARMAGIDETYGRAAEPDACGTAESAFGAAERADIVAADAVHAALTEMALRITGTDSSCSVHIRRGDYLKPDNAAFFGGISTDEYYEAAFSYVRERHPEVIFYIFSDDPGYVREKYGDDPSCVVVDVNHGDDNMYDIYLMSLCDAHICANSSFSFWGARLDPQRESALCIRPTIHAASQVFDPEIMRDLWKNWIFIDSQGIVR